MNLISRLFGKSEVSAEVICPHCERAVSEGHDIELCARKRMSRRYFFGALGGVAAGAAALVAVPEPVIEVPAIVVPQYAFSHNLYMTFCVTITNPVNTNWDNWGRGQYSKPVVLYPNRGRS